VDNESKECIECEEKLSSEYFSKTQDTCDKCYYYYCEAITCKSCGDIVSRYDIRDGSHTCN